MNQRDSATERSLPELVESPAAAPVSYQAMTLNGIIRAAATANLQIDDDLCADVAQLLRSAVDGLLEAADILSKQLSRDLDTQEGGKS